MFNCGNELLVWDNRGILVVFVFSIYVRNQRHAKHRMCEMQFRFQKQASSRYWLEFANANFFFKDTYDKKGKRFTTTATVNWVTLLYQLLFVYRFFKPVQNRE